MARLGLALLFASIATCAHAAAMDVALTFTTLPSAQGWAYAPSGAHAGAVETNIFSTDGTMLAMNSMGQSNGVAGGSIFYQRLNGITTSEPKQVRVRVRCLRVEGSANAPAGQGGLYIGFSTGAVQYGFSLTPTGIYNLGTGGFVALAGSFDNTQFHDYVFDWASPSSYRILRDGVQVGTGSTGFAVAVNRIAFGDGTGGANAHAEITSYRYLQGTATPAPGVTWGSVRERYRR